MPLTDTALRGAKPANKPQKLFDGNGLFLFVAPSGTKSWRLKYRFQGHEKLLTFGTYPQLSLKEAREACTDAKKQLSGGTDPSAEKKLNTRSAQTSFETVAREWHANQTSGWTAKLRLRPTLRIRRGRQAGEGSPFRRALPWKTCGSISKDRLKAASLVEEAAFIFAVSTLPQPVLLRNGFYSTASFGQNVSSVKMLVTFVLKTANATPQSYTIIFSSNFLSIGRMNDHVE